MPTNITRESLSSEVLQVVVQATVELDAQDVDIAVIPAGTEPISGDFDPATWLGADPGFTRTAELPAASYAAGSWDIYIRVTDTEVPVLYAGRMLST